MAMEEPVDYTTFSNVLDFKISHTHLVLKVDFEKKNLSGYVEHDVERLKEETDTLILDSLFLVIKNVSLVTPQEEKLLFNLGKEVESYGAPLEIKLTESVKKEKGFSFKIRIEYETTLAAPSLQWLEPIQTAGKVHPYMFSQCQCINTRSMLPCQDTTMHKIKYTASITAPRPLTVLMSGTLTDKKESENETTFSFIQKIPICSYLIAVAVGNLESREIGPRSSVWSEPEMVERGAYEFANTEKYLKAGEEILTPYVWDRYDILLLPPSFPYGGMENPQITFVSTTLLAGDRSLDWVVAHEIAHSWMGNTVTCKYWAEFFVTEGFNVFLERKITARAMNNKDLFDFEGIAGLQRLRNDVYNNYNPTHPVTCLRVNCPGMHPDDMFCNVPFEKGFTFLYYLQTLVGEERFEEWLRSYIYKFQYQSISAETMKNFFIESFKSEEKIAEVDWDTWFNKPGMPIVIPNFSTKLLDAVVELADKWINGGQGTSKDDFKEFTMAQIAAFLEELVVKTVSNPLSISIIEDMESEMHKKAEFKQVAESTFRSARQFYHIISVKLIAKDLGISIDA